MNFTWSDYKNAVRDKNIVCYGAGVNAQVMLQNERMRLYLEQIRFFVDRDLRVQGQKLVGTNKEYVVCSPDRLVELDENYIILVTLTDYTRVGKMLDQMGLIWFPWTVISADLFFESFSVDRSGSEPVLFLLNTPDYMNLGDQAIAVAEDRYLRKNFGKYYELGTHVCHPGGLQRLKNYIRPNDVIMLQGGGNMGSLWRVCEEIVRNTLQLFPDNPVVIFPQSVYYGDSEEEQDYFLEAQALYNSHKDLLICVRDQRSYDFVKRSYTCECMLLPDMVLTLKVSSENERSGIGVLLRNDKEQALPDNYGSIIQGVIEQLGEDLIPITHHPVVELTSREELVIRVLEKYRSCRLVITDRLHGMIFAAITNTPCIAFDNSYHKVSDVYKTWLTEDSHVTVSMNLLSAEQLFALIRKKLTEVYEEYNSDYFERKLQALTEHIKLKGFSYYESD